MNEQNEEDEGGYQLYRDFLAEKADDLAFVPDNTTLEQNKSADKEEHGHPDLYKIFMDRHDRVADSPEIGHMVKHNQNHCETTQCIDILNSFSRCQWARTLYRNIIVHINRKKTYTESAISQK